MAQVGQATLRINLVAGRTDALISLRDWLAEEPALRGTVELLQQPPAAGELGPVIDTIAVVLGPGGAATVLAGLMSWLRSRHGDFEVVVERKEEDRRYHIKVSAKRVRGLTASDLNQDIELLAKALDGRASLPLRGEEQDSSDD